MYMYNPPHQIELLGNKWETTDKKVAISTGKGSNKSLTVNVRFDGFGNAIVRFTVTDHGTETEYEKFDEAATAYNRLP